MGRVFEAHRLGYFRCLGPFLFLVGWVGVFEAHRTMGTAGDWWASCLDPAYLGLPLSHWGRGSKEDEKATFRVRPLPSRIVHQRREWQ